MVGKRGYTPKYSIVLESNRPTKGWVCILYANNTTYLVKQQQYARSCLTTVEDYYEQ